MNGGLIGCIDIINGKPMYQMLGGFTEEQVAKIERVVLSERYIGILSDFSVIDDNDEVKDDLKGLLDEIYFK